MFRSKKYNLVVDIGNRNIKILEGRCRDGGIEIAACAVVPTPAGSMNDGRIVNCESIVEVLRRAISDNGIKAKKVTLTISGTGVVIKYITVIRQHKADLRPIVEEEMSKKFNLNLDGYILDFKVLSEKTTYDGEACDLFVAAVPTIQVEEHMKMAELLNSSVEVADIPANCITKFLFGRTESAKKVEGQMAKALPCEFLVADIGACTTSVYIFKNGKLRYNYTIANGSGDIDRAISEKLNLSLSEAEQIKKTMYIDEHTEELDVHNDMTELSKMVSEVVLSEIVQKIKLILMDYAENSEAGNISNIYICGGGSNLMGIDSYLGEVLGLSIAYLKDSYFHVQCVNEGLFDKLCRNFPVFINCMGALVRD